MYIKGASRYLGVMLGPASAAAQWHLAVDKWSSRSLAIAATGAAASVSARLYNTRAVPTLGYLTQLRPLPCKFGALERRFINKMLRVPGNTFGSHELFNLNVLGGPEFLSIISMAHASAVRTATKTVISWPLLLNDLVSAAAEQLPLRHVVRGCLSQPFWDEIPMASFLHSAFCFSLRFPAFRRRLLASSAVLSPSPPPLPLLSSPLPRLPRPLPRFPLPFSPPRLLHSFQQGDVYKLLVREWYPNSLSTFCRRRLEGPFQIDKAIVAQMNFSLIYKTLSQIPYHINMTWAKTIANGWTTSSRLHSCEVGPCIFCHAHGSDSS